MLAPRQGILFRFILKWRYIRIVEIIKREERNETLERKKVFARHSLDQA